MLNVILWIVGVVFLAGGIAIPIMSRMKYDEDLKKYKRDNRYEKNPEPFKPYVPTRKNIKWLICGVVALIFSLSFTIIPTGYTGVRVVFGQVNEETAQNGFNWKIPFVESIKKINNKQQDVVFKNQIWSETAERTTLYYENVTVTYTIGKDKSSWIYANVSNYEDSLVTQSLVASAIKESSKTLNSVDATNRGIIEPLSMTAIQTSLDDKYGDGVVVVNKVIIDNADFEKAYNKAIAKKQNAQLAYEKQQIENKKMVEQAEAEAQAKVKKAEGAAEAKRIEAQAEADANKALSDSLSEDIFKQMMLDKWNGELPKVVGEGQAIFDIGSIIN